MHIKKHLYCFVYDNHENDLCKLESKYLFNKKEKNKVLFSDIKAEPSSSPFIKNRLDIVSFSEDYAALINQIKEKSIFIEGFKVEYLVFEGDTTQYPQRLEKLKDIGYSIEGNPDYYNPTITYGLCHYDDIWCFGILTKNKYVWHKHIKKPYSYSSSINIKIAKALVNIAAKTDKEATILDACCGVGTIMLEACFAGKDIEGCDISWKVCKNARGNLAHFNYTAKIYRSDIKDISKRYDVAIIDLPYNLLSTATDDDVLHIIKSTAKITDRMIIVSIADITNLIKNAGFEISDYCSVGKKGKAIFARKIWVCKMKGKKELQTQLYK